MPTTIITTQGPAGGTATIGCSAPISIMPERGRVCRGGSAAGVAAVAQESVAPNPSQPCRRPDCRNDVLGLSRYFSTDPSLRTISPWLRSPHPGPAAQPWAFAPTFPLRAP